MLAAGELPHLRTMLQEGGGRTRAVTAFPSTTSIAYLPFLTGCTPGRCNVPSIRWLDRAAYRGRWWRDREAVRSYCGYQSTRLDRDISPDAPCIFQLVPESTGIFTPVTRGLSAERNPSSREHVLLGLVGHYALWHQASDASVARHLLRAVEQTWRFIFAQFPAVDGYTHQSTPEGPRVQRALRRFDAVIGRLRDRLRARGELEDTLILMVSDHGASVVHTHLDLADWFRDQGVPTLSHPVIWTRNPRAAVMVAGNGSAMIYADPGRPRIERWNMELLRRPDAFGTSGDLVGRLVGEEAVAFVVGEAEAGGLIVLSGAGEARLRWVGNAIGYETRSADPLEVGSSRVMGADEWLEATWDSTFPDAPFQLLDQFRAARTGDLVVIAREGFDFRKRFEIPEHTAGHGSLIRAHMQVPVWSSHSAPINPLRTVDLFPAMLDWLGVQIPEGIEGSLVWSPGREIPAMLPMAPRSAPTQVAPPALSTL